MLAVEATAWDVFAEANPIFDFGDFAPTTGRSSDAGGGTTGGSVVAGFTASTSAGAGFVAVALSAAGVVVVVAAAGVVVVVAAAAAVGAAFSAPDDGRTVSAAGSAARGKKQLPEQTRLLNHPHRMWLGR